MVLLHQPQQRLIRWVLDYGFVFLLVSLGKMSDYPRILA
jgi:hypothetical protein